MIIPLTWLKEFVTVRTGIEKLAEKLTFAGASIEDIALPLSYSGVVVGLVQKIQAVKGSKNLNLALVSTGRKKLKIICGASNLQVGQKVPVAQVGSILPNGLKIEKRKIMGTESEGMICSEEELKLADKSEGIMVLPENARIGASFNAYSGADELMLAEITPNRGDLFSIIGIAREVAAFDFNKPAKLHLPEIKITENPKLKVSKALKLEVKDSNLCSQYAARVIKIKQNLQSPIWMQARLNMCGIRPINAVVDITNYVMLELGQPLHAFDHSKIGGRKIVVRKAKKGEKIKTLDEKTYELSPQNLVIADSSKPIAIAGVMGGKDSEVDAKTKTIILESAEFNPLSLRKTAQALQIRTEAVSRFEKKIDYKLRYLLHELPWKSFLAKPYSSLSKSGAIWHKHKS